MEDNGDDVDDDDGGENIDVFQRQCEAIGANRTEDSIVLELETAEHHAQAGKALRDNYSIQTISLTCQSTDVAPPLHDGLVQFLQKSPSLQKVEIRATTVNQEFHTAVLQAIKGNPRIRFVDSTLNSETCDSLVDLLTNSKTTLKGISLLIHGDPLSDAKKSSFSQALAAATSTRASLSELSLQGESDFAILDAIPSENSIKVIGYSCGLRQSHAALIGLLGRATRPIQTLRLLHSYPSWTPVFRCLQSTPCISTLELPDMQREDERQALLDLIRTTTKISSVTLPLRWSSLVAGQNRFRQFWEQFQNAFVENGSITSLSFTKTMIPVTHVFDLIGRCDWLCELHVNAFTRADFAPLAEAIGSHSKLARVSIESDVEAFDIQDLSSFLRDLSRNRSLRYLKFKHCFRLYDEQDEIDNAPILAEYLACPDSCVLTHLELHCEGDDEGLAILCNALELNQTLESLVIHRADVDVPAIVSVDPTWTDVLVSSMGVNHTLTHLHIPSLHLEKDLDGILAEYLLRNKYWPLITNFLALQPARSHLPSLISFLVGHTKWGPSLLFGFLKEGEMDLEYDGFE